MTSRVVPAILLVLLVVIHAQLWVGRGSLPNVSALQRKLDQQRAANAQARLVNEQLASEVDDLRAGLGLVEERARIELGMVKPNEIFVQVAPRSPAHHGGNSVIGLPVDGDLPGRQVHRVHIGVDEGNQALAGLARVLAADHQHLLRAGG